MERSAADGPDSHARIRTGRWRWLALEALPQAEEHEEAVAAAVEEEAMFALWIRWMPWSVLSYATGRALALLRIGVRVRVGVW